VEEYEKAVIITNHREDINILCAGGIAITITPYKSKLLQGIAHKGYTDGKLSILTFLEIWRHLS